MSEQRHQTGSGPARTGAGPFALGYLRLDPDAPEPTRLIADGIAVMEETAARCGYTVTDVFVDDDPQRHLGWASLLDAARTRRPVAVLVPDLAGLRLTAIQMDILRARLRYTTTAPLVPARPTTTQAPSTTLICAPEPILTPELPALSRDTTVDPLPPPAWATHSIPEDGGVTHERISRIQPLARHCHGNGTYLNPTDVGLSAIDLPTDGQWTRAAPTIQVEAGSYPLDSARQLRDALTELLNHADTAPEHLPTI